MENSMGKDTALDKVFELMEQLEKAKQPAIDALLAQKQAIDEQLARLGYTGSSKAETRKRAPRTCQNCGQTGHSTKKCPTAKK
jgi:predicted Zn-ribbon and HTH transcriptional regulator